MQKCDTMIRSLNVGGEFACKGKSFWNDYENIYEHIWRHFSLSWECLGHFNIIKPYGITHLDFYFQHIEQINTFRYIDGSSEHFKSAEHLY